MKNNIKGEDIFKEHKNKVLKDRGENRENSIVVRALDRIIEQGVTKKASDIHIEPLIDKTRIRYRIDGILYEENTLDISLHTAIISRLKIVSHLDITEKKIPQDGKFRQVVGGKEVDFRVSIVPLITGEKGVIRILDREIMDFNLENLGFSEDDYKKITKLLGKKSGILLACGPTGSGKSSLLYSILKRLNDGKVNISTVEDPVEYEILGVNQVQYNQEIGRDFATILKSFLRQDPDILMIGEIRDYETAEIAIKSALTGHLVLSTLHTNDAVGGIARLINLGIEKYMVSATVLGLISQRLVRKLCPHCKEVDKNYKRKLKILGCEEKEIEKYGKREFFVSKGCDHCGGTGYIGRTAIFEIFILDEEISEWIDGGYNTYEILKSAKKRGFVTMVEDGISKASSGITSLDEIIRQG